MSRQPGSAISSFTLLDQLRYLQKREICLHHLYWYNTLPSLRPSQSRIPFPTITAEAIQIYHAALSHQKVVLAFTARRINVYSLCFPLRISIPYHAIPPTHPSNPSDKHPHPPVHPTIHPTILSLGITKLILLFT